MNEIEIFPHAVADYGNSKLEPILFVGKPKYVSLLFQVALEAI